MLTIGITGGIGSGKSLVTKLFAEKGVFVVDADSVAREVMEPGKPAFTAIREYFGLDVFAEDGSLNRKALRERIFNKAEDKAWLEALLHPLIRASVRKQLLAPKEGPFQIYSAPLLLEQNQQSLVDRVLVVDCPVELQMARAAQRDDANSEAIGKIIQAQLSRAERLQRADLVIDNSHDMDSTARQVDQLYTHLLDLAQTYEH